MKAQTLVDILRDETLRELLSYCRATAAEHIEPGSDWSFPYNDVADRLAKILDGEL